MTDEQIDSIRSKATKWISFSFDFGTRRRAWELSEYHEDEMIDCFYKNLEFGTGGLRGLMDVGTNRVNVYTIGMATQGLCNYLKTNFAQAPQIKVVVAHDSRNNSRLFAEKTAGVFAANGIKVYLFEDLRPTPELSFAIRHLDCQSGVVITASHNPKEYNGYKAYWNDGGQVVPPHDKAIIEEVNAVSIKDVKFDGPKELIETIGAEMDDIYVNAIAAMTLSPDAIEAQKDMKIVYTPIHGAGVKLVPMALKKKGFTNIYNVPEQDVLDGNFPTVKSPNPEDRATLTLALQKAQEVDADIVMSTDPDVDRVSIAVKNKDLEWVLLDGNQAAAILVYYMIKRSGELGQLANKYIVKTIVTTDLLSKIASKNGVPCYDVLTGFKWIAELIRHNEGKQTFLCGGEESYGYLCGEFVREKDAVLSCAMFAEIAAWAKQNGKTLFDILLDIYVEYGFYKEVGISIEKTGKSGAEEIVAMMNNYRNNPPKMIADSEVIQILDYKSLISTDTKTGKVAKINLPQSDVFQYITEDGTKITIRPSGTEPKIKYYISVNASMASVKDYHSANEILNSKIDKIKEMIR
jgi:phosphoglucomutase